MLEMPLLDGIPDSVRFGADPPAFERLARTMAAANVMDAGDLRVGSGGMRRLVEKPLHRWWAAKRLPAALDCLPLAFDVLPAPPAEEEMVRPGRAPEADSPVLVVTMHASPQRCYLKPVLEPLAQSAPEFVQHAIAVLYEGLDCVCHAITPREQLAFARAYWWMGGEDKADPKHEVMTRRQFDVRVAPIAQAPRRWPPIVYEFARIPHPIEDAVRSVEALLDDPRILRPNAEAVTGHAPTGYPVIVRWRHGDPVWRLLDDHRAAFGDRWGVGFQSLWEIPTEPRAFLAFLDRVEATVNFLRALNNLIRRIASPAGRMPFFL